jgi:hypothetical protein
MGRRVRPSLGGRGCYSKDEGFSGISGAPPYGLSVVQLSDVEPSTDRKMSVNGHSWAERLGATPIQP